MCTKNFIKMPRILFSEKYEGLSNEAKLLYCFMQDRLGVSRKNNWTDTDGNAYIIYTVDTICRTLSCSKSKALRLRRELIKCGLMSCVKRYGTLPDIIYLNDLEEDETAATTFPGDTSSVDNLVKCDTSSVDNSDECDSYSVDNLDENDTSSVDNCTNDFFEVSKSANEVSNTNSNKNKRDRDNDIYIHECMIDNAIHSHMEEIHNQIGYEHILAHPRYREHRKLIDYVVDNILSVRYSFGSRLKRIKINGVLHTMTYIGFKFAKITMITLMDIIDRYLAYAKKSEILNPKKYLMSVMFTIAAA